MELLIYLCILFNILSPDGTYTIQNQFLSANMHSNAVDFKLEEERNTRVSQHHSKQESCLKLAIFREARNQSLDGKKEVAGVVLRRAKASKKDVCSVIYEKRNGRYQFHFVEDKKLRVINPQKLRGKDLQAYRQSSKVASLEYEKYKQGKVSTIATHFKRCDVENAGFRNLKLLYRKGDHCFFKA